MQPLPDFDALARFPHGRCLIFQLAFPQRRALLLSPLNLQAPLHRTVMQSGGRPVSLSIERHRSTPVRNWPIAIAVRLDHMEQANSGDCNFLSV
jgi:hypothetical protein